MDFWVFVLSVVTVATGGGVATELIKSRTRLAEKRMDAGHGTAADTSAIKQLREEIKSLRDTTLQYDLSFDTALQRMEQRVERLEQANGARAAAPDEVRLVR